LPEGLRPHRLGSFSCQVSRIMSLAVLRHVFICLALAAPLPARAADITPVQMSDGNGTILRVSGPFNKGDDQALVRALLTTPDAIVVFDSPGGNLMAGLGMGRALRLQSATTVVDTNGTCASACALAWLGGVRRLMDASARVGFHAAYFVDTSGNSVETGSGNALVGAYLNQLGLSDKAVYYITQAAPAEMQWLSADDADALGIHVKLLAPANAPPSSQPPAPARVAAPAPQAPRPAAPAQALWMVKRNVSDGYINARTGPGTMHGILFRISAGESGIVVQGCQPPDQGGGRFDWCRVTWNGKDGWVSSNGIQR
ncbi:MAG: hypothetical protein Q7J57_10625, partial [Gemmobacter sp.]|nr:hypothetical protein [Gemmobacter sp.]